MSQHASGYIDGYASRSRYLAMAGPVVQHLLVEAGGGYALLCSGGAGIVGNGAGRKCRVCFALALDLPKED